MTDLTSFNKADLVDDHVADDVNKLIATSLRAELVNTETISATKSLVDNDCPFQVLTASGADRDVKLPASSTSNHPFVIYNAGSNNVVLKDSAGTTTFVTLASTQWVYCISVSGQTWKLLYSRSALKAYFDTLYPSNTLIEGLKLIWNSATSITVDIGYCYAQNGDRIPVSSQIVKSSLSLSASTMYHVYVYLSSGVAAAEVVTTAPTAWKSGAYSKTADTSRRYVGSVLTDGSGNVYKFVHNIYMNSITYVKYQLSAAPFRCLTGGTASTATAVSLAGVVPVTANLAYVRVYNTADQVMRTSEDNGVSATQLTAGVPQGNTINQAPYLYHAMDASRQIWYAFAAAVGAGSGNIDVAGYTFER